MADPHPARRWRTCLDEISFIGGFLPVKFQIGNADCGHRVIRGS
jgi:hypothetical protein